MAWKCFNAGFTEGNYLHCKKIPVKLTVKLPAAVLPNKNRKIYGNDNDNRYFFTGKNP